MLLLRGCFRKRHKGLEEQRCDRGDGALVPMGVTLSGDHNRSKVKALSFLYSRLSQTFYIWKTFFFSQCRRFQTIADAASDIVEVEKRAYIIIT